MKNNFKNLKTDKIKLKSVQLSKLIILFLFLYFHVKYKYYLIF
jgi:hypothetical protein